MLPNFVDHVESLKLFNLLSRKYYFTPYVDQPWRFLHDFDKDKKANPIFFMDVEFYSNFESYFDNIPLSKNKRNYRRDDKNTKNQNALHLLFCMTPFISAEFISDLDRSYCAPQLDITSDTYSREEQQMVVAAAEKIKPIKSVLEEKLKEFFPKILEKIIEGLSDDDLLKLLNSRDDDGNTPLDYFCNHLFLVKNASVLLAPLVQRFKNIQDKNAVLKLVLNQDNYGKNVLFRMVFTQDPKKEADINFDLALAFFDSLLVQDEKASPDAVSQKAKVIAVNTPIRAMLLEIQGPKSVSYIATQAKEVKGEISWTILDEACYRADEEAIDTIYKVLREEGIYWIFCQRMDTPDALTELPKDTDFQNQLKKKFSSWFKTINANLTEIYFNLAQRRGDDNNPKKLEDDYVRRLEHFQNLLSDLMATFLDNASITEIKPREVDKFPKRLAFIKESIYRKLSDNIFVEGVTPHHLYKFINFLKLRADWQPVAREMLQGISNVDQFLAAYDKKFVVTQPSPSSVLPSVPSLSSVSTPSTTTAAPSVSSQSEQKIPETRSSVLEPTDKVPITNDLVSGLLGFLTQIKTGKQLDVASLGPTAAILYDQLMGQVQPAATVTRSPLSNAELLDKLRLKPSDENKDMNTTPVSLEKSPERDEPEPGEEGSGPEGVPNPTRLKK